MAPIQITDRSTKLGMTAGIIWHSESDCDRPTRVGSREFSQCNDGVPNGSRRVRIFRVASPTRLEKQDDDEAVRLVASPTGVANATFDALLIWRDANRDGICQLGEVFPASRVLAKVYLGWLVKRRLDANGNGSQAQGFADFKGATGTPVEIYDVILATL
jgi:hypothetical protein